MRRTALITGASKGIGRELAIIFARQGYDLVLVARSKALLEELGKKLCKKYKIEVTTIEKDLTCKEAPEEIFQELEGRRIDILVNNAGFGDYKEFAHSEWEKQYLMIQLNVTALMHMTKLFLPNMIKQGYGKVLNLASTAAFLPGPNMSVYYASKAAVLSFSQAISKELKGCNVTVTALCPGPTSTNFERTAGLINSRLFHSLKVTDAKKVALYGYKALMKGKPVAVEGLFNKMLVISTKLAPRGVVLAMIDQIQSKLREGQPADGQPAEGQPAKE
ncbi:SDR family NAD(P)-dependent oxidoreductase [Anaerocolumna chitinilytica]|uniref:Short-chain dehydrogenase n=1 Tax=Anaerocolumna chitinilytica TaxID=1727145 RepID=A0A7I8DPS7_9FIRM|nr:SDR family oxidoreductase [Anaerocolumna chitinilytica]BCJ99271.1 short-chain dehydrogenase [Anaerocolumna chitinilytica]